MRKHTSVVTAVATAAVLLISPMLTSACQECGTSPDTQIWGTNAKTVWDGSEMTIIYICDGNEVTAQDEPTCVDSIWPFNSCTWPELDYTVMDEDAYFSAGCGPPNWVADPNNPYTVTVPQCETDSFDCITES